MRVCAWMYLSNDFAMKDRRLFAEVQGCCFERATLGACPRIVISSDSEKS
jgi:hypothetical protein